MFGKVFVSMYEGSMYGQWQAIITMQQFIVLADAEGYVDMTPPAIAARTSIPLEIIEAGIKVLSEPDPYSRTPDNNGKRIELIDPDRPWGWRLVNHAYYRDLASKADKREKDRIRIAEKRAKSEGSEDVAECREPSPMSPMQKQKHKQKKNNQDAPAVAVAGLDMTAWTRWETYRREIRKPIKPASMQAAQKKLAGLGAEQLAAVEHSIANGYQGIYPPGGTNETNRKLSAVERVAANIKQRHPDAQC